MGKVMINAPDITNFSQKSFDHGIEPNTKPGPITHSFYDNHKKLIRCTGTFAALALVATVAAVTATLLAPGKLILLII